MEATLEDVAEVIEPSMGGRRKMRGGDTKSAKAVKDLVNGIASAGTTTMSTIDTLGAKIIENAPAILSAAVVTKAVNSPTVFANIVSFTREAITTSIKNNTIASWSEYLEASKKIITELGGLGIDLGKFTVTSPYFAFVVASAVMKYRASQANMSILDLIKSDASTVASSATRGVTGQIQAFNDAWSQEATKKAADTLREIGSKVERPPGKGAEAISMAAATGAPALRSTGVVPGRSGKATRPSAALERLSTSTRKVAGPTGGKRKTKKRVTKKRVTRRRSIFSY